MAQEPKKHHYLPEFFTSAWCRDGQLIRYVNRGGTIHTRPFSPGQIGYRKDLYRLLSAQFEDRTIIERHHFEQIDNAAAPAFEMMNSAKRPLLTARDRYAVARFALSLPARNPWGIAKGQDIAREVYGLNLSDAADAEALGLAPNRTIWQEMIEKHPKFVEDSTLFQMIEASTNGKLIERVYKMEWNVWDVSDSPFDLIFGDRVFSAHGDLNKDLRQNVLAIPVGPKRFLTVSAGPMRALKPREMAMMMNREQASRAAEHIFAKDRNHTALARKYLRRIGTWKG